LKKLFFFYFSLPSPFLCVHSTHDLETATSLSPFRPIWVFLESARITQVLNFNFLQQVCPIKATKSIHYKRQKASQRKFHNKRWRSSLFIGAAKPIDFCWTGIRGSQTSKPCSGSVSKDWDNLFCKRKPTRQNFFIRDEQKINFQQSNMLHKRNILSGNFRYKSLQSLEAVIIIVIVSLNRGSQPCLLLGFPQTSF